MRVLSVAALFLVACVGCRRTADAPPPPRSAVPPSPAPAPIAAAAAAPAQDTQREGLTGSWKGDFLRDVNADLTLYGPSGEFSYSALCGNNLELDSSSGLTFTYRLVHRRKFAGCLKDGAIDVSATPDHASVTVTWADRAATLAANGAPGAYDADYFAGTRLIEAGNPRRALPYLERAKRIEPNAPWADFRLGEAYLALGDAARAAPLLETALAEFERVSADAEKRTIAEGVSVFTRYNIFDPHIQVLLGEAYLAQRQADKANAVFAAIRRTNVIGDRIHTLSDRKQPGDRLTAAALAEVWARLEPDDWQPPFEYGELMVLLDKPADAVPWLQKATKLQPADSYERANLYFTLGAALFNSGKNSEAQAAAEEALDAEPIDLDYAYLAGASAFKADHYGAQIAFQERLLQLDPSRGSTVTYSQLGIAHAVRGDYARAAEVLATAARQSSSRESADEWRIAVAYAVNGWNGSSAIWQETHPPARTYDDIYTALSPAYRGLRDLGDRAVKAGAHYAALAHYSHAYSAMLELSRRARVEPAWARQELDDVFEKLSATYRALPFKPALPQTAHARLAAAEGQLRRKFQAGTLEAVAPALLAAAEEAPWSPEIRFNLALAAAANGVTTLPWAIEEMERFSRLAPDHPRIDDSQKRVRRWRQAIETLRDTCRPRPVFESVAADFPMVPQLTMGNFTCTARN